MAAITNPTGLHRKENAVDRVPTNCTAFPIIIRAGANAATRAMILTTDFFCPSSRPWNQSDRAETMPDTFSMAGDSISRMVVPSSMPVFFSVFRVLETLKDVVFNLS